MINNLRGKKEERGSSLSRGSEKGSCISEPRVPCAGVGAAFLKKGEKKGSWSFDLSVA